MGQSKAVVLGGTGHIGAAIARRFHAAGFDVVATGHRHIERPNLNDTDITIVAGDDSDPERLSKWIEGASVVVDCATPYPIQMYSGSGRDTKDVALARTKAVIHAVDAAGAGLVLVSSFTTLPRQQGFRDAIRRGALEGAHPYFELKAQVERVVRDYLAAGGRGAIVAPSTCFGPYDMKDRKYAFIPMLLAGEVPILANQEMNVVDVRDVADVVLAAAGANLGAPIPVFGHNISLKDLARQICEMNGVAAPKTTVPTAVGVAGLHVMETAFAVMGRTTPWPSLSMLLLAASYPAPPSDMQLRLHGSLRPLGETLSDATKWYQSIGMLG